jgi:hypothetical protein
MNGQLLSHAFADLRFFPFCATMETDKALLCA